MRRPAIANPEIPSFINCLKNNEIRMFGFDQGGKSGSRIAVSPPYLLDPRYIPDPKISGLSDPGYIADAEDTVGIGGYHGNPDNPEDTVEIQRIQEIRWRLRESKGYDRDPTDTASSVSAMYRMYREGIGCIATVSSGSCGLSPYPG